MNFDATDRTLGLVSIWQVLRKLHWEIMLIKSIPESLTVGEQAKDVLHIQDAYLYAIVNAASTSLALVDWLFHTTQNSKEISTKAAELFGEAPLKSDKDLLLFLRESNHAINACHQICNSNKHYYLKPKSIDRSFKVLVGDIVIDHPDGTTSIKNIAHVIRNRDNPNATGPVITILDNLAAWWLDLLQQLQIPEQQQFFHRGAP